jgi:membrane protease YdiL (CAAX protease family)
MKEALVYYTFLIPAWIAAWLLHEQTRFASLPPIGDTIYWTIAKLLLWILPVIVIVRWYFRQQLAGFLSLNRFARGARFGAACGAVFVGISFTIDIFARDFGWPRLTAGLASALVIAPLFEEIVFRGYVLSSLERSGTGFWRANLVAALMFLGLHVPGWYFMGTLTASHSFVVVSLLAIGLTAGYARRSSGSTWGSIVFHFINNLYAAFIS